MGYNTSHQTAAIPSDKNATKSVLRAGGFRSLKLFLAGQGYEFGSTLFQ